MRTQIKETVKAAIEKVALDVLDARLFWRLPEGVDLFHDLRTHLPHCPVRVVFDVGANVGQSAATYLSELEPDHVYCFEPGSANFRSLNERFQAHRRVQCFDVALGAQRADAELALSDYPTRHRLTGSTKETDALLDTEHVKVDTVDRFCTEHDVSQIDFMKIDTEGHDLEVLKGAENMLDDARIDVVQVEASMNRENKLHVALQRFMEYLENKNYFLFRIYDQVPAKTLKYPYLQRANPVFVSRKVIEENKNNRGLMSRKYH